METKILTVCRLFYVLNPHAVFHMWHTWHLVRYVKRGGYNSHASLSALFDIVSCPGMCVCVHKCVSVSVQVCELVCVCVCVKWCFLLQLVVLSVFSRGSCCGVLVLPWAAYEKAPVLITWSTRLLIRHTLLKWHLLITPSFFRNSFLDFIQAPSCSLSCRNKQVGCCGSHSLFDWKWVSKQTNRHLKSL